MFYIGYIIYLWIWSFGSKILYIAINSGAFAAIEGYFEIDLMKFSTVIKYIFMAAPLLRFFIKDWKKKNKVLPICWLSSFLFIVLMVVLNIPCGKKFEKFEPKLWQEYPKQRWLMYDDLKENNLLDNLDIYEVEALLGKPDNLYVLEEKTVYEYDIHIDCEVIAVIFKDNIYEKMGER